MTEWECEVIAHRGINHKPPPNAAKGATGLYPENSVKGFIVAGQRGLPIEVDIQKTKDDYLVCSHDDLLDLWHVDDHGMRVGDPELTLSIQQTDLADLQRAGLVAKTADNNELTPLLEHVIDSFKGFGLAMHLELKSPGTALALRSMLADVGLATLSDNGQFVISSFSTSELERAREAFPKVQLALLRSMESGAVQEEDFEELLLVKLCASALHVETIMADTRMRDWTRERGLKCRVYTVNDALEAQRLVEMGFDGIFTDYPDSIKAHLREKELV